MTAFDADLWPGAEFGIRPPFPAETPLSWEEVNEALRMGLILEEHQ